MGDGRGLCYMSWGTAGHQLGERMSTYPPPSSLYKRENRKGFLKDSSAIPPANSYQGDHLWRERMQQEGGGWPMGVRRSVPGQLLAVGEREYTWEDTGDYKNV